MKIHIPSPCAQKYENMSPSELGRMCKVCNTEVIDFTHWETKDIVDYIQQSNQKVCGKLNINNQKKTIFPKWNKWSKYIASVITLSATGLFSNVYANYPIDNSIKNHHLVNINSQDSITLLFVNDQNMAIPSVILIDANKNHKFLSNNKGNITVPYTINEEFDIAILGYKKQKIKITKEHLNRINTIVLSEDFQTIGEIVVEPLSKIKNTISYKEINLNRKFPHQNVNSNNSLKNRIKKWLSIFSKSDNK